MGEGLRVLFHCPVDVGQRGQRLTDECAVAFGFRQAVSLLCVTQSFVETGIIIICALRRVRGYVVEDDDVVARFVGVLLVGVECLTSHIECSISIAPRERLGQL